MYFVHLLFSLSLNNWLISRAKRFKYSSRLIGHTLPCSGKEILIWVAQSLALGCLAEAVVRYLHPRSCYNGVYTTQRQLGSIKCSIAATSFCFLNLFKQSNREHFAIVVLSRIVIECLLQRQVFGSLRHSGPGFFCSAPDFGRCEL